MSITGPVNRSCRVLLAPHALMIGFWRSASHKRDNSQTTFRDAHFMAALPGQRPAARPLLGGGRAPSGSR